MPLIKLLKTSTFRLAVIYLALFAASAITLLAYVYWNTAGFLARQTDEAVEVEIAGLADQYRQGGLPLLVHTVIQRSRDPGQSLYLVLDPAGRVLAGTLDARPQVEAGPDGWFDFSYNRKTLDGTEVKAARARAFFLQEGSIFSSAAMCRNAERSRTSSPTRSSGRSVLPSRSASPAVCS